MIISSDTKLPLGQLRFEHRVQFYGNCLKRVISALISTTESDKQVSILSTGHMTVKELWLSQHFQNARDLKNVEEIKVNILNMSPKKKLLRFFGLAHMK